MKNFLLLFLILLCAGPVSHGLDIGAFTVFGCDSNGAQDGHARWNTGPVDACWDLFVYEGDFSQDQTQVSWLNNPNTREVKLTLGPGSATYTFHFDSDTDVRTFGLNLFGVDRSEPVISVFAPVTLDADEPAPFQVNCSNHTMGWPLRDTPGAGVLSYSGARDSLWIHESSPDEKRFKITDFKILTPEAAGNVDFVGPGETEASGRADYVGQFTITQEPDDSAPPDWLLWLGTVGAMKIGPNNRDGAWRRKYETANVPPSFSFLYDGQSSDGFLNDWTFKEEHKPLDDNRVSHQLTWLDSETGLEVCWKGLEFTDYESVEWTIYLRNTGDVETPIIEEIKALNVDLRRNRNQEYTLRHWKGTDVKAGDYAPMKTALDAGKQLTFRPTGWADDGNRRRMAVLQPGRRRRRDYFRCWLAGPLVYRFQSG